MSTESITTSADLRTQSTSPLQATPRGRSTSELDIPRSTTGQIIADSLLAHGVDTVFGIPGVHTYELTDALQRAGDSMTFIPTRHEQGAGYMAYGYAKSTGKPGVYAVVPGPGMLNSSGALCTAYGAGAPVMCLTGNVMSDLIGQGRGQVHELPDQLATMRGLTKWAARIEHPNAAADTMAEAFKQMRTGRVRPVAVETPWDVFGMSVPAQNVTPVPNQDPPKPDPLAVERAAEILRHARNPLIWVGGGALDAGESVLELAELLQAPVTSFRSGKGIVSEKLPYGMSFAAAHKGWKDVDVLIGIGTRLEMPYLHWRWTPPGLKVIRIDIDPSEMVRLPPDLGIVSDSDLGARALVKQLTGVMRSKRPTRVDEFVKQKKAARNAFDAIQPQVDYLSSIRKVLPDDGIFVEEVSQVGFAARYAFPVYEPRSYISCGYQETLGFGFNTALGVKVANPDRPVVSVCGDGGFLFGIQELATAVQHRINVVTIVFNNNAYGNVRRDQLENFDGCVAGAELENPDFVRLSESFGANAYRVSTPADLESALSSALSTQAPAVIEVPVERGSEASPWPFIQPPPPDNS